MLGKIANILTAAQNALVQSAKNTQAAIDKAQQRLASGKAVNSALDGPSSFFISRALSQRAEDLRKLLDGISLNIQTIKGATAGVEAISKLIDQAEALLQEAQVELYSGEEVSLIPELTADDIADILAANPGVTYFAATRSFYRIGSPTNWNAANTAARAATLIQPPNLAIDITGVTGHLANITSAAENAIIHAMSPTNAWLGGSDAAVEGTWRWLDGAEAGQQFWSGGPGGTAVGGMYENWGGGEPNNSGNEDYVHMRADGFWNDLPATSTANYVIEWDESLLVRPVDPQLVIRAAEYSKEYLKIMDQITALAKDTQYRGVQLLKGESLRTDFNPEHTHFLQTEGIDATAAGLGLSTSNFLTLANIGGAKEQIREARNIMRSYASSLATDLSIITIRSDFTHATIGVHEKGSSILTDADKNEVGAEMLALQIRQQLQTMALRLGGQNLIQRLF